MKNKIRGLLAVGLLAGPIAANAVTLHVNANGILTGASNVNVGGTLYDVQFLDGSCISLFTGCQRPRSDHPFIFPTAVDAEIAAQALLDQVFTDTPLGQFDSDAALTNGCTDSDLGVCGAVIPWFFNNDRPPGLIVGAYSWNRNPSVGDDAVADSLHAAVDTDFTSFPDLTYAVWSVPEPGTLGLLVLGLVGLALTRRRRAA